MTGSCERNACDGARLKPGAVGSFAAHPSKRRQLHGSQQGISSTDKDVMNRGTTVRKTGGFSSSFPTEGSNAIVRVEIARLPACGVALVDGRCRRGLDSGAVSVKLPLGAQKRRPQGRFGCAFPDLFRITRIVAPAGRRRGDGQLTVLRTRRSLPSSGARWCGGRRGSGGNPSPDPKRE